MGSKSKSIIKNKPTKNDIKREASVRNPSRKDPSHTIRNTNNKPKKGN
jgi:hypothetical protein